MDVCGTVDLATAPHSDKSAEGSTGQLEVTVSLRVWQAVAGDLRAVVDEFVDYLVLLGVKVDHL